MPADRLVIIAIGLVGFIVTMIAINVKPKLKIKLRYISFRYDLNGEKRCIAFYLAIKTMNKNDVIIEGWKCLAKNQRLYSGEIVGSQSYFVPAQSGHDDFFIFDPAETLDRKASKKLMENKEITGLLPVGFPDAPVELLRDKRTRIEIECHSAGGVKGKLKLLIKKMIENDQGFLTDSQMKSTGDPRDLN